MNPITASVSSKRRTFRQLHQSGCFVIPNPWDIGTARMLQGLGFQALATTSAGFAWSRARADNRVDLDMTLAHLAALVAATDVPINADFESGFAADAKGVAESVRLAVETGVAGLSIEDSTGSESEPLYALDDAVVRVSAARSAIDRAGGDALLVARAECFIVGRPDLEETMSRLRAYANAGADCLYAPGPADARTDRSGGRRGRAQTTERPDQRRQRTERGRPQRTWRATRQRGRCAGVRWRARPGVDSCAQPSCWPSRGALMDLVKQHPARN